MQTLPYFTLVLPSAEFLASTIERSQWIKMRNCPHHKISVYNLSALGSKTLVTNLDTLTLYLSKSRFHMALYPNELPEPRSSLCYNIMQEGPKNRLPYLATCIRRLTVLREESGIRLRRFILRNVLFS